MDEKNKEFFCMIGKKTVIWGATGSFNSFTEFEISPSHFKKMLSIINEDDWAFIQPREAVMGSIEGYMIFDGRIGTLLCVFGKQNIPLIPLKSIFPLCRTEKNIRLAKQLKRPIREKFESYQY